MNWKDKKNSSKGKMQTVFTEVLKFIYSGLEPALVEILSENI